MFDENDSTRRALLRGGAGMMAGAGLSAALPVRAEAGAPTRGDIDILRFLAAAELVEYDLWQQYTELGRNNAPYAAALGAIDGDLVVYSQDTTEDELSHAEFLNAYLASLGARPVNLDAFRVLPSSRATGARRMGRLTNLTSLTVDTSYFLRYRSHRSPDFGATFHQVAMLRDQPAIPPADGGSARQLQGWASVAAFHFASIEQGGMSLYNSFLPHVSNAEVVHVLASIYATEAIHYAIFEDQLDKVRPFDNGLGTLVVPDLQPFGSNRVMPFRCTFLSPNLPTCSVIRPGETATGGAVAAANALTRSGLFEGQSPAFFAALLGLAKAADAAVRQPA